MAGRRSVGNEDHPFRNLAFDTPERGLAKVGSDSDITTGPNPDQLHVLRVHRHRPDAGLVLGIVLADIDLLALLRRAAGVHDEAFRHWRGSERTTIIFQGFDH